MSSIVARDNTFRASEPPHRTPSPISKAGQALLNLVTKVSRDRLSLLPTLQQVTFYRSSASPPAVLRVGYVKEAGKVTDVWVKMMATASKHCFPQLARHESPSIPCAACALLNDDTNWDVARSMTHLHVPFNHLVGRDQFKAVIRYIFMLIAQDKGHEGFDLKATNS